MTPGKWMKTGRAARAEDPWRRSKTFPHWDCEGTKPLLRVPAQRHQLQQLLDKTALWTCEALLWATRGGTGEETWSGCVRGCAGRPAGPAGSLGPPAMKGSGPSCAGVALGMQLPEPREWAHREVSSMG